MPRAFVIRPFGKKTDSVGRTVDFDKVHKDLIEPALNAVGLDGGTTGEIVDQGNIRADMFALILEADLIVCDITVHNANVFYELGIRHAMRKKRTVLIKGQPTEGTPFDLLTDRYLAYQTENLADCVAALTETLHSTLRSDRETDSPVFQMLPNLSEADPSNIVVVPFDFSEEVERARSSKALGWLRLLAEEVQGMRFQWDGLRLVASAQWDLKDYTAAMGNFEAIRDVYPYDIPANLALANIYERHSRSGRIPKMLTASDQAIERVLANPAVNQKYRVEALALKGRNAKTRWRLDFEDLTSIEDRRNVAMNRGLITSYEAYRTAFLTDLNGFYPGLSALQMAIILAEFSTGDRWFNAFQTDDDADRYRTRIQQEVTSLRHIVPASVSAGLACLPKGDEQRVWAEISNADVLFLTEAKREQRVIDAYRGAIPTDKPFAWDAARGQLALFASLGIQSDLANKVIAAIDPRFDKRPPDVLRKPERVVIFAGHRVDEDGRLVARFPQEKEEQARSLIQDAFVALQDDDHELVVLASAAPGADILAHEVCASLGLKSIVCLPMPSNEYSRSTFKSLETWRSRFLDIQYTHKVWVLSDKEGLPRWLEGKKNVDAWERGNRWVMQIAQAWGAGDIVLIALWDGREDDGDARGGTAHMVQLASDAGNVKISSIDSKLLL